MPPTEPTLEIHPRGPGEPFRISGHGNAYQAADLHAQLGSYLDEAADHPAIDLRELVACDVLTLQILLAAGPRVEWTGPVAACVVERCAALGLPLPFCAEPMQ